ncbi:hypothetical protein CFP56_011058, partial [Quercus suber]
SLTHTADLSLSLLPKLVPTSAFRRWFRSLLNSANSSTVPPSPLAPTPSRRSRNTSSSTTSRSLPLPFL